MTTSPVPALDYQHLFHSLHEPHIVFAADDPLFTIVEENRAHAEVGMAKRRRVIGRPLLEAFPDNSASFKKTGTSELVESLRRVAATGEPDTMPNLYYDLQNIDGTFTHKTWNVTHYPIFDAQGTVAYIYQSTEDITEKVAANRKFILAQQRLDQALANASAGTWLWDMADGMVSADKNVAYMFNLEDKAAAAGLPLKQFTAAIHHKDRSRVKREIAEAVKSHTAYESEYRTIARDKSIRWIIARGHVELDGQGKPGSFPGVIIDITERKVAEDNLAFLATASAELSSSLEFEKTFRRIAKLAVPNLADWCSIEMLDDNGLLQQVAVAHKDPAKVRWAKELRQRQGAPDMKQATGVPKVIRTGEPELYPFISDDALVAAAQDESQLTLLRSLGFSSVIIVPLKHEDKAVGTISLISTELMRHYTEADLHMATELANRASLAITNARLYQSAQLELAHRERLQKRLAALNAGLEEKVAARTDELNQLNVSLQRSNQELESFAYVASHDLQEPLRKIQAFGNLLEEEYAAGLGDGADYLRRMQMAAHRMSTLINDLLEFSRVATRSRPLERVVLNEMIESIMGDLESRIEQTGGTVTVGKLPTIWADPMQMRQLFQNLLSNALKFHKPDVPPKVSLDGGTKTVEGRRYAIIRLQDNGIGFDEKYLDRIFAVFQRLHARSTYEGTGIGLAVCRKIVERHGGSITAASTPGEGSIFTIKLPIRGEGETNDS